jgi:hypothetical protein
MREVKFLVKDIIFLGIRTLNISNEAYASRTKGCRIVVSGCTVMMVQDRRGEPYRGCVIDMRESIIIHIVRWGIGKFWRVFGEFSV